MKLSNSKEVVLSLRVLERAPGLVDRLLDLVDADLEVNFEVHSYQQKLEVRISKIGPEKPVGCSHEIAARRYSEGAEVCGDCGERLGDCMHPDVFAAVGATEGECNLCHKKVPVAPAAEADDVASDGEALLVQ